MKNWYRAGVTVLIWICGPGAAEVSAQAPPSYDLPPLPGEVRPVPSGVTSGLPRLAPRERLPVLPTSYQPPGDAALPGAPDLPSATMPAPGVGTEGAPATPGDFTEPLSTNTDLSLPAAEREGLGGEPTVAVAEEAAAAEGEKNPTQLLMNALGLEDSPIKIYGWIQNSFTGNANGNGTTRTNFGVNPNYMANKWMGNQYYLIVEKPVEQNDEINFGFRVDNLFGHDWAFNHMYGLFDDAWPSGWFPGYDPAQFYAEMHIPPVLSKGGTDVKGGRFYTILGYEVVPAVARPLLSVPYMFTYGQPFTHFGVLATTHVTDRVNWINGTVNGWDRFINENYKWGYIGGVTWTSKTGKTNLAISYTFGPNQFPRFLPEGTSIYPFGTTPVPFQAGRRNAGYASNWRTMFTTVLSYRWTDTLTQVVETDQGFEDNVPGIGPGGTAMNAEWYSFGNWFLWQFWKVEDRDIMTGVWRSEVFRDDSGARTGFSDNFYEMTLGLIIKPKPYIWIRPEIRYDWAQFKKPYTDGTRGSQLTLGFDAILLY